MRQIQVARLIQTFIAIPLSFQLSVVPMVFAEESLLGNLLELSKSVVSVHGKTDYASASKPQAFLDKETGRVFTVRRVKPVRVHSTGAGIIIDAEGLIATNAHVTENKKNLAVTLHDGTSISAAFVGFWPNEDLAILRIDPPYPLKAIPFADSDAIKFRDRVFSIGQSQYSKYAIAEGVVRGIGSLKNQQSENTFKVHILQITFSVYRGDSGSPVLDTQGRLVGMMTAKLAKSHKMSYALASNIIRKRYKELKL